MMNPDNNITREELRKLCDLYFEGDLSREEEKALALLLSNWIVCSDSQGSSASSDKSSESIEASNKSSDSVDEADDIIRETIFVMGLERSSKANALKSFSPEANKNSGERNSRDPEGVFSKASIASKSKNLFRRIAFSGIAAAAIIGGIFTIWKVTGSSTESESTSLYTVYVNGKEVKDPEEAKRIAEADYSNYMAMLAQMEQLQKEKLSEFEETMESSEKLLQQASRSIQEF